MKVALLSLLCISLFAIEASATMHTRYEAGTSRYGNAVGMGAKYGPASNETPGGSSGRYGNAHRPAAPNILLIIGDDFSKNWLGAYGAVHANVPTTPNIDAIALAGYSFSVFYAADSCAPTQASLLTGRWTSRHGVIGGNGGPLLTGSEVSFAQAIQNTCPGCYDIAAFGKYNAREVVGPVLQEHAARMGFKTFNGRWGTGLGAGGYKDWTQDIVTSRGPNPDQITRVTTDLTVYADDSHTTAAIAYIAARPRKPWVVWYALNNAHTPLHDVDVTDDGVTCSLSDQACFELQIEKADENIGQIIAAVDIDNTIVIFLGDNGSSVAPPAGVICKQTATECAVNVAAMVAYGGVVTNLLQVSDLVTAADVAAYIVDLAGGEWPQDRLKAEGATFDPNGRHNGQLRGIDGMSLRGISNPGTCTGFKVCWERFSGGHDMILTESLSSNFRIARDFSYKYQQSTDGGDDEFFDLTGDPNGDTDLLGATTCALAGLTSPQETACETLDAFLTSEYTDAL